MNKNLEGFDKTIRMAKEGLDLLREIHVHLRSLDEKSVDETRLLARLDAFEAKAKKLPNQMTIGLKYDVPIKYESEW